MKDSIQFIPRPFPSANMVLVHGDAPILIDSGFGSDLEETLKLIQAAKVDPEALALIVNTHYHCDHAGGNFGFQSRFNTPIAAHTHDAQLVNARNPESGAARFLDQVVEPYRVTRSLEDGDLIETGALSLRVVHTPGHTRGHLSLFDEQDGRLICGDAVHADDVCWLNPFLEGENSLAQTQSSIRRLAALNPRWMCSGHGPATDTPAAAFDTALARYDSWRENPERMGWHATKRIFAYYLMLCGGIAKHAVDDYLLGTAWYPAFCQSTFDATPEDFIGPFMDEMIRSKAARWENDRLLPGAPYTVPATGWRTEPGLPEEWPN